MFRPIHIAVVLLGLASAAFAHEAKYPSMTVGDLVIHTPVLRVAPKGAPVAGDHSKWWQSLAGTNHRQRPLPF